MEQQRNLNSTPATKGTLQSNVKDLIEALTGQLSPLPNIKNTQALTQAMDPPGQTPLAPADMSSLSEGSINSSDNSVGYIADTSEVHQPSALESPVKEFPVSQGD